MDLHRKIRQGAAEVIYGAGKTPEQMIGIVSAMLKNGQDHNFNYTFIIRSGRYD